MPTLKSSSASPFHLCPSCGGSTAHPFAVDGVCLRCAGLRALGSDDFALSPPLEPAIAARSGELRRIGCYEIIDEIGRGGMGRVYAARQAGLGRIVALKALPDTGNAAGLELRFLREAGTAARLRHPHIVAVHDSGRADGYVFFTMDYVEGGDLAHRLRTGPLAPRAAAAMLHQIATALAYTHGEGVLHRDLKPSNILLDGDEPRLADFGLAAQLDPGGDLTAVTGVLGTPHYLAPEALRDGSAALTAASDLYALGVIFYEMITGRTPFAGASAAQLPLLIEQRQAPAPRLLAPALPRDLETICLKLLEREPDRRYASAAALAEDLRRFLADEPILARPPSAWKRLTRYARRHRGAFAVMAAFVTLLVAATIVSSSLALRARRAEQAAAREAAAARAISDFLRKDVLAQASPSSQPDRDLKLRTVLDRAAQKIDGRFPVQPTVEAELRETLADTYAALGDCAEEKKHLDRAVALLAPLSKAGDANLLILRARQVRVAAALGEPQESATLGRDLLAGAEESLGPEHPALIQILLNLASAGQLTGDLAKAERCATRALALARRLHGPEHPETRRAMIDLSSVYWSEHKLALAEPLNREVVELLRRALGPEHPETLMAMHNLASVYWAADRLADAERLGLETLELRRRVLGPAHPETLRTQNNLGTVYEAQGRRAEALALAEDTLAARRRQLGPEHPDTLSALMNLAMSYFAADRLDEAGRLLTEVTNTSLQILGPDHRLSHTAAYNLAHVRLRQDNLAEARTLFTRALESRRRALGPDNSQTLIALEALATVLAREERYEDAEALFRNSLAARAKSAPQHWRTHQTRTRLGALLVQRARYADAEPLLLESAQALLAARNELPISARHLAGESLTHLIELYTAWGKPELAAEWKARVDEK